MTNYLIQQTGKIKEAATVQSSAGAGDADKIPSLDGTGRLSDTFMPVGIGADTKSILASENLAAGDLVNVYDNTGTPNVRKADASSTGKEATGFVLSAVTSGNNATVYFEGIITGLSGITAVDYYLSGSTAGQATATPVSTSGYITQRIGRGISTTEISFEPAQAIELA